MKGTVSAERSAEGAMTDQNEMNRINEAVEAAVEKAMEKAQEKDKTGGQAAEDLEKRISEAVNKALDGRLQSKGSQEGQHPPSVTVQSSPSHSSSSGKFILSKSFPRMG